MIGQRKRARSPLDVGKNPVAALRPQRLESRFEESLAVIHRRLLLDSASRDRRGEDSGRRVRQAQVRIKGAASSACPVLPAPQLSCASPARLWAATTPVPCLWAGARMQKISALGQRTQGGFSAILDTCERTALVAGTVDRRLSCWSSRPPF